MSWAKSKKPYGDSGLNLDTAPERGCVEDQPQQCDNAGILNLLETRVRSGLLRLVEDATAVSPALSLSGVSRCARDSGLNLSQAGLSH
jgi:hypothetical protein